MRTFRRLLLRAHPLIVFVAGTDPVEELVDIFACDGVVDLSSVTSALHRAVVLHGA